MKILLTGATGFLGKVIKDTLLEHQIVLMGRSGADINVNLSATVPELPASEMVIHAAGKAHVVPKTEREKEDFYTVNVKGTENLLAALLNGITLPKYFVFISSVAVYGRETGLQITEDSPLLAKDPYGQSKIAAESLVQQWCYENNVICTILRLPLVAGRNPSGNLKSMINGIKAGYYFNIAGGLARKSMVMAEDVALIIPKAALTGGIYNLTDGVHPSFAELAMLIASQLDRPLPSNIPSWLAALIGKLGDFMGNKAPLNTAKLQKITLDLTFDDSKAVKLLNWAPTSVIKGFKIK